MLSILNSKAAALMKRLLLVKSMGKSNLFISAAAWLYNELTYTMPLDILYKFVYKKSHHSIFVYVSLTLV